MATKTQITRQADEVYRQFRIELLADQFPQLPSDTIARLVDSGKPVYTLAETGYQYGNATKSYWKNLGFNVTGRPRGVLVIGIREFDLYSTNCLTPKTSRITVNRLRSSWLAKYGSKDLVLANAIRIANRLQKVNSVLNFYYLKDRWIKANQDKLIKGRITRIEKRDCWDCYYDPYDEYDSSRFCVSCQGTGRIVSKTLYEHEFLIQNQKFGFHSYIEPATLSEDRAKDLENYGRPFLKEELPCPPQDVIVSLIESLI